MAIETDEQIAARKERERAVQAAWRGWKKSKRERRIVARLPAANSVPKAIIVTRDRVQDGSGGGRPTQRRRRRRNRG
jgi:hypothetical protein